MGTTGRTRLTSAGLPNPRTADVRDPPGRTVPAGFPLHQLEDVTGIMSIAYCGMLPLSRDPTMPKPSPATALLSALPNGLFSGLFAKARPTTLAADQVLFISGDEGDGCYRVDDGLLKVSVVAPAGGERILAVLGPGAMVGEL